MADMDIEAIAGAEFPALQAPQNAHLNTSRSSDQGPPMQLAELPQMEPGLRNRHPTGQSTRDVVINDSSETRHRQTDQPNDRPWTPGKQ